MRLQKQSKYLAHLMSTLLAATMLIAPLPASAAANSLAIDEGVEIINSFDFEASSETCPTGWTLREEFGVTQCDHIIQSSFHALVIPADVEELGVLAIGGGGGGGGGGYDIDNDQMLAGGGGGAGAVVQTSISVTPLSTINVVVGSGGAGGSVDGDTYVGSNGSDGNSTFISNSGAMSYLVQASGGRGGQSGTNGGSGGASGNGYPGGSGFTGSGSSAGGGGGGRTATGTSGAANNGGDGGLSAYLEGENGLPMAFDQTHSLRAADVVPYANLFPTLDHYPNIINFTALGFGGGGAVVTSDGNGCDDVRIGNNVTLDYDTITYEGYGACLMGPSGTSYNGQAGLDMSGAYPGQGGSGGAGMGQIFVGPSSAEFSSANVETYEAGTQGVDGIVWLTFSIGPEFTGSYIEIIEEDVLWGEGFSYETDAPIGTTVNVLYNGAQMTSFAHSIDTSFEWSDFPFLAEQCRGGEIELVIGEGEFELYDYAGVQGNSLLESCWGHWDAFIKPRNEFLGVELDQILVDTRDPNSRSFEIDDWSSSYTSDAFDDFGVIRIGEAVLAPQQENCTFAGDGAVVTELFYDSYPTNEDSNGDFDQVLVSCDLPGVVLGSGAVDFRVDLTIQGSMIGWYLYTTGVSGTPSSFRPAIEGELGSDGDSMFRAVTSTPTHNAFISYGDSSDPIIGYRSTFDFTASYSDGDDVVTVEAASLVTPVAGDNLVYMLELWLVDYNSSYESSAIDLAVDFAAGDYEFGHCLASVLSASPTLENQCGELQPVPYFGPVVTNDPQVARSGSTVTYVGTNLDDVVTASVANTSVEILSQSATSITLSTPTGLANGMYDVDLHYADAEVLTLQNGLVIQDLMKVWTQLQSDNTVKMYAKNIIGEGKIQFFHNSNEIAWVRATNALNPKLRQANGSSYLVRTRELVDGKNAFEIYQDGKRIWRAAYAG